MPNNTIQNYTSSVHNMQLSTESAYANDKACIYKFWNLFVDHVQKRIDMCSEIVQCEGRGIYIYIFFFNYIYYIEVMPPVVFVGSELFCLLLYIYMYI
jgi:hypothetical protein